MSCESSAFYNGRFTCLVSGSECVYLIPNSKRCAEDYGEGPDAPQNKCEDCERFYLENGCRCCRNEPLRWCDEQGDFIMCKHIEKEVLCCGDFAPVNR